MGAPFPASRTAAGLLAALTLAASPAGGQVFQLQGGGSSLFEGYGGVVNMWGNGYEASLGVGYLDGLRLGWSARRLFAGRDTLRLGNDALPFVLETDVFGGGSAILAQGASIQRRRGRTTLHAFAGASADPVAAPYFASNTPSRAMAYVRTTYALRPSLALIGHAVITNRQTLLGTLRWTPALGITTSATAGVGSDRPFAAASIDARSTRLDVKGVYAAVASGFRRASAPMPLQSELERENVLVTWRATRTLTLSAGRQHFRHDSAFQGLPQRATLNQVAANASLLGTTLSAGVFASQAGGLRNLSASFSARRDLTARLQSEFYLLQVLRPAPARLTTPVLLLRETISPRLSLLQVITRDRGRTSVSFGGTVTTGLTSVSLDYQVAHSPFLTRNPFVQTIGINARLQLGSYGLSVGSFVTPDGKVHYSAQGSTFLYRGMGRVAGPLAGTPGGRVDRYVLNGRVVDEAGAAVEGAAVEVGGEVVYTDSRGRFFVRRPGASPLALRVVLDDFLVPGTFEVVQAPRAVTPTRDERLAPVTIVVRRLPPRR